MVGITMRVLALHKVDDVNMEFHMDMYFRQFWNDKRLAFGQSANPPVSKIKHASLKELVWVPDPFFVNQKEGKVLDNPADNTLFSIDKDGNVMYSSRQLVTTSCMMNLKKYPFDVQECRLDIESFSHSDEELLYYYKEANKTVSFQDHIDIPHFSLLGHKQTEKTAKTTTGSYKRLLITMYIKRDPQRYMHNSAIPSAIVVLVSSMSFWIDPVTDGGSRGLVVLFCVLALTYVYLNTAASYLVLNYYTLSDLYFFNCYGFLLLNVLVFLLVLIIGRSAKSREEAGRGGGNCLRKCLWLDVVFRLVFVPLFLVYFVIFVSSTTKSNHEEIEGLIPYMKHE